MQGINLLHGSGMFGQVQARKLPRCFETLLRATIISMVAQTSLQCLWPFQTAFAYQQPLWTFLWSQRKLHSTNTDRMGCKEDIGCSLSLVAQTHYCAGLLAQKSRLTCCAQLAATPLLPAFPSPLRENCCAEHTAQLSMRLLCAFSCKPSRRPYAEHAAQPGASSSPSPMRPRLALRELKRPPTCSSPSPRRAPC